MNARRMLTAVVAAVLVAGLAPVTASATTSAEWQIQPYNTAAVKKVSVGEPFTRKEVTAFVPVGEVHFDERTGRMLPHKSTHKQVTARSNGTKVQVEVDGVWRTVPYRYAEWGNKLVFEEQLARRFGIRHDPLGAVAVIDDPVRTWTGDAPTVTEPTYKPEAVAVATVGAGWRRAMVGRLNALRAKAGVAGAGRCYALNNAAQYKAKALAATGQIGHTDPFGYKSPTQVALASGGLGISGESVAVAKSANLDDAFVAWRKSAKERAPMLNPAFTKVGFGMSTNPAGKTYFVAEYGTAGQC